MKVKAAVSCALQGAREAQEDYAWAGPEKGLFLVCDGFGGPKAGAEASQVVSDSLQKFLIREAGDEEATLPYVLRSYYSLAANVLFNALVFANRKLLKRNAPFGVHERGGASAAVAFVDDGLLSIANIGVCSAWLFRKGEARELVMPRTLSQMNDPFEQNASEHTQIPLTALGIAEDLEPEVFEYRLEEGDRLLLTTDGINRKRAPEVWAALATGQSGTEVVALLEELALSDNAAVTVVDF